MKRREFNNLVGVGLGVSLLPTALTACEAQTQNNRKANITGSGDGFEEVGTVSKLEEKQFLKAELADGEALIISDSASTETIIAVNPTCPHAGCSVSWESDQQKFICPCHDSEFSSQGKVIKGPATEPLTRYEVKLQGDSILVKTI